ncbi:hypothetical protein T4B_11088 [Trichinella pseudospiralis]|uniref:Uncharacterized protein n=1 Tax=Trichinella pseudospiralis TaxID=6337 RepID=A0A0V1IR63_TRIPS|nr:hypothetical protein T4B_11088 [Trichinella pseudospiralis]KRZ36919.1 hypothetical protein T4C_7752 [Trichinella pseudospiralis]
MSTFITELQCSRSSSLSPGHMVIKEPVHHNSPPSCKAAKLRYEVTLTTGSEGRSCLPFSGMNDKKLGTTSSESSQPLLVSEKDPKATIAANDVDRKTTCDNNDFTKLGVSETKRGAANGQLTYGSCDRTIPGSMASTVWNSVIITQNLKDAPDSPSTSGKLACRNTPTI